MQLCLLYEKTGLECFVLGNHYVNSQLNNETDSENDLFLIDLKIFTEGEKKRMHSPFYFGSIFGLQRSVLYLIVIKPSEYNLTRSPFERLMSLAMGGVVFSVV